HVSIPAGLLGLNGLLTMTSGTISSGASAGLAPLGGIQKTGALPATISANLNFFSGARTLTVDAGVSGDDLVITGIISEGSLVKAGAGTLSLFGANTYAGPTAINAGTVKLGSGGRLSDRTAVTVGTGATLDLRSVSTSIGSLAGFGTVALTTGSARSPSTAASSAFRRGSSASTP